MRFICGNAISPHCTHLCFRPLIIRKCLQNYSSVLWLDATQRLTSRDLEPYLRRGRQSGIVAWFRVPEASSDEGEDDDDDEDGDEDSFKRRHKLR